MTDCQGTWRERFNPEAPEVPMMVCDGCGETFVIRNGKRIDLIPARTEELAK